MEYKLPLRIIVVSPPVGFKFWLAGEAGNKVSVTESKGEDITFDFEATVKENRMAGVPNFTGPFAKGTPSQRVFNIASEGRGAKVWITGYPKSFEPKPKEVTWDMVKAVAENPNKVLMARYVGTDKDGRPSCATVELIDGGWIVAQK